MRRWAHLEAGFSLVELLVASAIVLSTLGVLFHLAGTGRRLAHSQPDAADMQQRLRVAADMIQRDLLMAGAGLVHGAAAGPLVNYLPPVLPYRLGASASDPEMSFFSDRVTILQVPHGEAAAPLVMNMPFAGADVPIANGVPGCPGAGLCGFEQGTRALIVDTAGAGLGFDLFSVSRVAGALGHGSPDPPFSRPYPAAGTRVVPVRHRVYYFDAATRRVMSYDGHQTDVPLAENIVSLRFQYLVDPAPDAAPRPLAGAGNCVYAPGSPPIPLLADLGGPTLQPAGASLLTDGPACGLSPNRFDGDLFRIRRVRVTIRAQVADRALRGAGADFLVPGVSSSAESYAADLEVTFDVTPRNLVPTR
jgi:hypothetical protein